LKTTISGSSLFVLLLLAVILYSCVKDPSDVGLALLPQSDHVIGSSVDTCTVVAWTKREDSLTSDERSLALLGSYTDPVFGRSDAGFISQVRMSSSNLSFGTNPVGDSIVLYLNYNSYYGDTLTSQTIHVSEITDTINVSTYYYSNMNPQSKIPVSILNTPFTYTPRLHDDILKINLNSELAQRIVTADVSHFTDNTAFVSWFKGIYVYTDPISSGGAIIYYNLLNSNSKMTLYYHNSTDTSKFDFLFNTSCARINLFQHDYSISTVSSLNDSINHNPVLYLQAMSGLMTKIKFPYISELGNNAENTIVKAELVIPIDETDPNLLLYKQPSKLLLVAIKSNGLYEFVPDYYVGTAYFGGSYDATHHRYIFNISRYIQQLAGKERTDLGLALIAGDNRVSANRVMLKSPTSVDGMKLSITYLKH
jgi:hypothetical protein